MTSSSLTKKSGVLATLRFSSGLVFLVLWRRLVRIRLEVFSLGFKLELEERPPVCNSRNFKIRSLLCMLPNVLFAHT